MDSVKMCNDEPSNDIPLARLNTIRHINLQLAALDEPTFSGIADQGFLEIASDLLRNFQEQRRLLAGYRCPPDKRIENYLNAIFDRHGLGYEASLPHKTFILDQPNLARELSLPADDDYFESQCGKSYRVEQGVLHNPVNDRRTTSGVFHIVDGGLPIPLDKKAVPVAVFAQLLKGALNPSENLLRLPFTSNQAAQASVWVSLLLRPVVSPTVPGVALEKSMETRFFAPGSLVSNLDFVERIFGNAGDPLLPENDAALDVYHWTGHTGCIILAPQLVGLTKKEVGLPCHDEATPRQRRDGMCWKDPTELYNDGQSFKIVCRDKTGVIVTLIADNYFGYSKKEIKSQISYASNLYGGGEEEHSGGAVAFARYNLGDVFQPDSRVRMEDHNFDEMVARFGAVMDIRDQGYAVDKDYPTVVYLPETARFDLQEQSISWYRNGLQQNIKLLADQTYIYPCGYKVNMEKHPGAPSWRLIGTEAEGTVCHKPCTVSGGGKSEISKSIAGTYISGPLYVGDLKADLDLVEEIVGKDYSARFGDGDISSKKSRRLLDPNRSLGSVIRLLTPASDYSDEYNAWLEGIPQHIRALVFIIKRFYRQEWGLSWRSHFSVDVVNGYPGHELKLDNRKLVATYLRVGTEKDGSWRIYKLRQDFVAAEKVQTEDDITVSLTLPAKKLGHLNQDYDHTSVKIVQNCEAALFQRPDDAIFRGLDKQTEKDLTEADNFISNFEPLTNSDARELVEDVLEFDAFTEPMKVLIQWVSSKKDSVYFVSSAHPRVVNGKPTLNVRYLQKRPDRVNPLPRYVAEIGVRLTRRIPLDQAVHFPVNAVLPGRRNNPIDRVHGLPPLAVYNPIHYQELPELFMDFICSLSGKSPSTTGAGSEGALTKGPFNSLCAISDLNNALVSFVLCGYDGFTSAAGYVGTHRRVDHDISFLIPELWCRLPVPERNAQRMIERGYLEKVDDFRFEAEPVLASRLGYRITDRFVHAFFGKLFDNPSVVFDEALLKPETQDLPAYVAGVNNIVESQRRVAEMYLDNGSVENACPPLKALLQIMVEGHFNAKAIESPEIRRMFTRDYLLNSDWYWQRLSIKQQREVTLWQQHIAYVTEISKNRGTETSEDALNLAERLRYAQDQLRAVSRPDYIATLVGTLGADWLDDRYECAAGFEGQTLTARPG